MAKTGIYSGYNSYGRELARKKRRLFLLKLSGSFFLALIVLLGLVYLFLFAETMKIRETNISGLETVESSAIISVIDSIKNRKLYFDGLMPYSNILFFSSSDAEKNILSEHRVIKSAEISKEFPHILNIKITERKPIGSWCFVEICRYFDEEGYLWGETIRSSGSLIINVNDLRLNQDTDHTDEELLSAIKTSSENLDKIGIKIKNIEIAADSIGDFRIYTSKSYYLKLDTDSDIKQQIDSLRILIKERGEEFKPEYIDLTVNGKIYYK